MGSRPTEETQQVLQKVAVVVSSLYIWIYRLGKRVSAPERLCLSPPFGTLGVVQWGLLQMQSTWGAVAGEGSGVTAIL